MALLVVLLIVCHTTLITHLCSASDSITGNKFLRDGDTIVSNGGNFALGFFSPGKSQKRYVGIWYNKVSEQTVVWVANRANPINTSSSGVLRIDNRGNLAIFDGNSTNPVWFTNASIPISEKTNFSTLFYKLLDSGNLVLVDENRGNRDSPVLWQSFDYPTHTMVPGMKIGVNLKLGFNWSLTSWKSPDDPSTGEYSTWVDQSGSPELFLRKGSQLIWRTGVWNSERGWSGIPTLESESVLNYSFVDDPDEISFYYSTFNTSIFSRIFLDDLGKIQRLVWLESGRRWNRFWEAPGDRCDNFGECGAFASCDPNNPWICSCLPGFEPKSPKEWNNLDRSQGCVRKRVCDGGDGFLRLSKIKIPDGSNTRANMSISIQDCESECRKNCSCTGYANAGGNGNGINCLKWFGDLVDIREYVDGGQEFFLRVDAVELANAATTNQSKSSSSRKKLVLICVLVALGLLLFIFISGVYYWLKRVKRRGYVNTKRYPKPMFNLPISETNEEDSEDFELPSLDLYSVMVATENFSPINKLGTGGFGSVYKGMLPDGREVAVKRLSKNSGQGMIEFKNEVMVIAKLQHRNLVQILGCCVENEEKILIYEYMPNKSLDFLLFDRARSVSLDWGMRHDIILGIARGVLYLHQDSRLRIIHRDLKASNILLDAEMNPKISDFGMAKIFGGNQTQANTNRVVGTYGYMSPEYALDGLFSIKSDVFSFGVLLLEIISGKKNTGYYNENSLMNLIKRAWELWTEGKALELVDPSMSSSFPRGEVMKFIQVGILCVQENAIDRPTMSSVVVMLDSETTIPNPKKPAFVFISEPNPPSASPTGTGSHSISEMSTTIVEGR